MHPWGKFWRLLDSLGGDSRYIKAQQDDPDVAEHIASKETDEDAPWKPANEDFTLMHEMVGEVRDLMADLVVITGRGLPSNGQRKFGERFPRPETELTKARERHKRLREDQEAERLFEIVDVAKARWRAQQAALAEEMSDALSQPQQDPPPEPSGGPEAPERAPQA